MILFLQVSRPYRAVCPLSQVLQSLRSVVCTSFSQSLPPFELSPLLLFLNAAQSYAKLLPSPFFRFEPVGRGGGHPGTPSSSSLRSCAWPGPFGASAWCASSVPRRPIGRWLFVKKADLQPPSKLRLSATRVNTYCHSCGYHPLPQPLLVIILIMMLLMLLLLLLLPLLLTSATSTTISRLTNSDSGATVAEAQVP